MASSLADLFGTPFDDSRQAVQTGRTTVGLGAQGKRLEQEISTRCRSRSDRSHVLPIACIAS